MSRSARMCSGIEFHAARPACETALSPNLVRSCGSEKSVDDVGLRRFVSFRLYRFNSTAYGYRQCCWNDRDGSSRNV